MIHIYVDAELAKQIENFRFKHRFTSQSETARWLMRHALEAKPVPLDKTERSTR